MGLKPNPNMVGSMDSCRFSLWLRIPYKEIVKGHNIILIIAVQACSTLPEHSPPSTSSELAWDQHHKASCHSLTPFCLSCLAPGFVSWHGWILSLPFDCNRSAYQQVCLPTKPLRPDHKGNDIAPQGTLPKSACSGSRLMVLPRKPPTSCRRSDYLSSNHPVRDPN